ncbi:glycosyltransferase family 4 protein [Pseudanabaena sp. UWO310]|uniref:glycosyltransferase family 4 protein n=1 Tax=Pseudanabaena sp. UWO310 TaxID=2480795 RepID=UPI00116130D9|nr:glycosyltransferase family 4 protein [Pseudanabaena sp. UWO310]TYQ24018.1 glycosyltransferase [Pseudanabaena sp. UWO310]
MNILHINQSDIGGGAAIAAYRLHQSLLAKGGVSSKLLVGESLISDPRIDIIRQNIHLNKQLFRFNGRLGLLYINILSTFNIPHHPFYQEADILNFHNLHGANSWFNYLAISKITQNKPTVFTLHDMWGFTGHCAYSYDCDRWKSGCGKCPYPNIYPSIYRDNTNLEWKLKNWVYSKSNLVIVAPSHWLAEQAQASMLGRFPIHHIPYGIDTDAYRPLDRQLCKAVLDIPQDKKVLLFGVTSLKDHRKGGDLLLKALQQLPQSLKSNIVLLTFGNSNEAFRSELGMPIISLGYINSDRLKSIAYSAADLFILPTRADNLPLVLQESMSCGTPMVSFDIGGVRDIVRPSISGYLATPENTEDFGHGIVKLLEDDNLRLDMSKNCRAIALEEYPLHLQSERYTELYQQILL